MAASSPEAQITMTTHTSDIELRSSPSHVMLEKVFAAHQKGDSPRPIAIWKMTSGCPGKIPADYRSLIDRYNNAHEAIHVRIIELAVFLHTSARMAKLEHYNAKLKGYNLRILEHEMHEALLRRALKKHQEGSPEAVECRVQLVQSEQVRKKEAFKLEWLLERKKKTVEVWEQEDIRADKAFDAHCMREVHGEEGEAEEEYRGVNGFKEAVRTGKLIVPSW